MFIYATKEETENWLIDMNIKNYFIHDNLVVDVKDNVNISHQNLFFIPIQFGLVNGDFDCSHNNLSSLKGSPYEVACFEPYGRESFQYGSFLCHDNELENLDFTPKKIFQYMHCYNNIFLKAFPLFDTQVKSIILNDNNGELIKLVKNLRPYLAKNKLGFYNLKFNSLKEYLEQQYLENSIHNATEANQNSTLKL
jgi:hypothetical protein